MFWHGGCFSTVVRVSIFRPRQVPLEGNRSCVQRAGPLGLEGNDHEGQRYNLITFATKRNQFSMEVIVSSSYSDKVLGVLLPTLQMECAK